MQKTILYIDDIRTNLFTMQSVLEDYYEVYIAQSAHEGLEILIKHKIDLILLDIMMPEIDGFGTAKMIRSNKKTKKIPIIFVTAKSDDETISQCYEIGGDDYVNKPFNHIELLARISFHLKMRDKERQLKEKNEYVQNIFDLQENMILTTNGIRVINVNKSLLSFFNISSLEIFQEKYQCICNCFVAEEGFFNTESLDENILWTDAALEQSKKEDIIVKIIEDSIEYIFNLKVVKFHSQYVITLTDITQISQLSLEYKHEANYDALTQVYNRKMFHRLMELKILEAKKNNKKFTFVILDIDFFKKVNDIHGHLVGDEVLKQIAQLLKNHIRDSDVFARWGGEEFVLAFDVEIKKGFKISDELRAYIEKEVFSVVGHITCSFGITEFKQDDTLETLTSRADNALYSAKESGRNKVCQL